MSNRVRLGVNIDHVATLRQVRGTRYPDPVYAALIAQQAGADGITLHLREDRRHIQERDVELLKRQLQVPMNLEIAVTNKMLAYAEMLKPECCCFVPEKRQELTTESGLDVVGNFAAIEVATERLAAAGIEVSLFIDPVRAQIDAAKACGAPVVELHTGQYAEAPNAQVQQHYLEEIITAAAYAHEIGLIVNAGHGLHYHNVAAIAAIPQLHELNIGHSIIAEALFLGMEEAVRRMKALL